MKIVQITDTHLVAPGRTLFGLDPAEGLRRTVAAILDLASDADLCVVTGDLTNAGEPEAYRQLADILAPLPMPVRLLLGNHDDRDAFVAAFPDAPRDGAGFVQSVLDAPCGRLVFLDSKIPAGDGGALCTARLAWLEDRLQEARDRPVWLFLHHPPLAVGMASVDGCGLHMPEAFSAVLDRHPDIRHLFLGHVHRPIAGSWRGIPFTVIHGTAHQTGFTLGPVARPLTDGPCHLAVALLGEDSTVVHMVDALDLYPPTPSRVA